METVLKILDEVKNASGNKKKEILEENKGNNLLKEVLAFVFNPFIVTGLSKKKINKNVNVEKIDKNISITDVFNYLKKNHTGRDGDISYIQAFILNQPDKYEGIYKDIFTKELKIGVNSTTINKVWDKLIPEYEVQQGHPLHKRIDKILNEEIILTQKFDGLRCTARVEDGNVQLFSRQGQLYEGLIELEEELAQLPNGVYDGELLKNADEQRTENGLPKFLKMQDYKLPEKSILNNIYAPMPSKELFKQTTSIVNSDKVEKREINFFVYDIVSLEEFDNMKTSNCPADKRKQIITDIIDMYKDKIPHIKNVPILYCGKFDSILIDAMLKQVLLCQQEGLMINLKNSPYEFKRSNNLIKVKKMYPADLRVIGFEEGSGKNKGTLGAIIVNYKGFPVKVGSGFTDNERTYFWNNKEELLGAIVTVQYFEETTNKKDNSLSLRFPVFKRITSETKRRRVTINE